MKLFGGPKKNKAPKRWRKAPKPRRQKANRAPRTGGPLHKLMGRLRGGKNRRSLGSAATEAAEVVTEATPVERTRRQGGGRTARLLGRLGPAVRLTGVLLSWLVPMALATLAFAAPMLGVKAYDYVMHAEHFQVKEVLVEGNHRLTYEDIKAIAGLHGGLHLLNTPPDEIAERLRAHPWVAGAEVEKELPDRLVVRITEHQPVAFLALGELWLLNDSGEPFAALEPGETYELPIITGVSQNDLTDPTTSAVVKADIRAALNLLRLHRSMGLTGRWPVSEVRIEPGRRLVMVLSGVGTEAVLGTGPFRDKLWRLEWVLENLHQQGKVADYVLLDGERGESEWERVVVRADVAPTPSELRKEAAAHAEEQVKKSARSEDRPESGGDREDNRPGADAPGIQEGLLPQLRRGGHGARADGE